MLASLQVSTAVLCAASVALAKSGASKASGDGALSSRHASWWSAIAGVAAREVDGEGTGDAVVQESGLIGFVSAFPMLDFLSRENRPPFFGGVGVAGIGDCESAAMAPALVAEVLPAAAAH